MVFEINQTISVQTDSEKVEMLSIVNNVVTYGNDSNIIIYYTSAASMNI